MSIKLKLSEQKDKGLHHAYVLVGEKESVLSELENFLGEDLDFEYRGHPDYFVFNYDSVNSDAAKEITSLASYSVREGTNRIIVIRASTVFPEAQNALLKSFEEPVQGTIFFVIVPTISGLLPTLLSRTIVLHHTEPKTVNKLSEDFLNGDYQSRIKIIESITKDLKDKKMERAELGEFIFVLEKNIYEQYGLAKEVLSIYRVINKINQYLSISGASVKMLLEWLALSLPRVA